MLRVWVAYEPRLFYETLTVLLRMTGPVEVLDQPEGRVDVGVFRLAETGLLQDYFHGNPLPGSKLIACSPRGDTAYIRPAGTSEFYKVQPFSMQDLLHEVFMTPVNKI